MFTTDGYVIPIGQEHKDNPVCSNITTNCMLTKENCRYSSGRGEQHACSLYALSNQHPTDSSKDYWHDFVRGR